MILKESINKYDIIGFIIAFSGVVVLNDPFNNQKEDQQLFIGTLWALSGVFFGSFVSICMRYMRDGIHYSIGPFWFAAGCCFWSPISQAVEIGIAREKSDSTIYDFQTCFFIFLVAFFTIIGQILLSKAFQMEKVAPLMLLCYT